MLNSMTFQSRRFDLLPWPSARDAAKQKGSTLVWPLGACEQHGPHLPLATDALFAEKIITSVLERLPASSPIWMLPAQSIGFSPEHSSFPGTISLSGKLLFDLITEVGQQAALNGFDRFLLFNAHGGQIGLLEAASRELRLNSPGMAVLPCFLWRGVAGLDKLIPTDEIEVGLHAGLAETSLMLGMEPDLVGSERVCDGDHLSDNSPATPPKGWSLEGAAPYAWLTKDLSETGVIGDSREANSSLGKTIEQLLQDHWKSLILSLLESDWPPVSY